MLYYIYNKALSLILLELQVHLPTNDRKHTIKVILHLMFAILLYVTKYWVIAKLQVYFRFHEVHIGYTAFTNV